METCISGTAGWLSCCSKQPLWYFCQLLKKKKIQRGFFCLVFMPELAFGNHPVPCQTVLVLSTLKWLMKCVVIAGRCICHGGYPVHLFNVLQYQEYRLSLACKGVSATCTATTHCFLVSVFLSRVLLMILSVAICQQIPLKWPEGKGLWAGCSLEIFSCQAVIKL